MLFQNIITSIIEHLLDDLYMIILFACIIFMINHSFTKKYSKKVTALVWVGICVVLELGIRGFFSAQSYIYSMNQEFFYEQEFLYNLFFGWGIWLFFLQLIVLIVGSSILYKEKLKVTLFMSITLYLFVSLIADYLMPILLVVFSPGVTEDGIYKLFAEGGGIYYPIIGLMLAVSLFLIYKRYLHKMFQGVYSMENFKLNPFTIIATISYVSYSILYLILSTVGVYPSAPSGVWSFVTVVGSIVIIYCIMYGALFIGISSAVSSTKLKLDLEVASKIQNACLPKIQNEEEGIDKVDVFADMKPAKDVGGDFYDYFKIDEKNIAFVIADVSDKGIPAALFMMMTKTAIKNNAIKFEKPSQILEATNTELFANNSMNMFVTCFLGILNTENGDFVYVNAGHNYPLIKRFDGEYEYLKGKNGFVLAGMEKIKYKDNQMNLKNGDILFLYTDGVTEAFNKVKNMYGEDRLKKKLTAIEKMEYSMKQIVEFIYDDVKEFSAGENQSDDITMLAFEFGRE